MEQLEIYAGRSSLPWPMDGTADDGVPWNLNGVSWFPHIQYTWQWCLLRWVVFPLIISADHGISPQCAVILSILRPDEIIFQNISRNQGRVDPITWAEVWRRLEWKNRASPGWSSTNRCWNRLRAYCDENDGWRWWIWQRCEDDK